MLTSRYNIKVKAFTLTELIITMIISSLVIILAYSVLQMMNGYFLTTSKSNELHSELLGFRAVFAKDVDQCDSIRSAPEGISIYRLQQEIIWMSDSGAVFRKTFVNENFSTFKFGIGEATFSMKEPKYHGLVEVVSVEIRIDEEAVNTFQFKKTYGQEMSVNRSAISATNF